jgi:hypothetical protein
MRWNALVASIQPPTSASDCAPGARRERDEAKAHAELDRRGQVVAAEEEAREVLQLGLLGGQNRVRGLLLGLGAHDLLRRDRRHARTAEEYNNTARNQVQ